MVDQVNNVDSSLELGLQKQIDMKKEILSELKFMQKLMIYSSDKTDSENIKIFEQIIGEPPADSGGGTGTGTGTGTGNSQPRRTTYTIPPELKDNAGVKAFQDWVVSKGKSSELGRFGADGKFGRFTSAAWTKYKNDYLNPVVSDTDVMSVDDFQGTGAVYSSTQPTTQTVAANTGTQTVTNTTVAPLDGVAPTNDPVEPTDKKVPDSL